VRGPSPIFAIVVSFQVSPLAIPAIRVARKEEDRRSYSLPSASGDHVPAHHSPTPFQCRGCELLVVIWTLGSLHRTASTSDILVVTRRHARPASVPTDALSAFVPPKWNGAEIDLRAEGLQRRLTREDKTGRSPRMPSVVSRTCEPKPTSRTSQYFFNYIRLFRSPFRLLSTRARVRRCFELPSG
jgi:hypothetical protein